LFLGLIGVLACLILYVLLGLVWFKALKLFDLLCFFEKSEFLSDLGVAGFVEWH